MKETVIEEYDRLDGTVGQTIQRDDGTEYTRICQYHCSICGAASDRPFPTSAISCFRDECRLSETV
jgi:hypothetical protein